MYFDVNGRRFNIPDTEIDAFKAEHPDAQVVRKFNVLDPSVKEDKGRSFYIPPNEVHSFMDAVKQDGVTIEEQRLPQPDSLLKTALKATDLGHKYSPVTRSAIIVPFTTLVVD